MVRDELIADRFGALAQAAAQGKLAAWESSPNRRLALILLLDQFPRQIYRNTAAAFAQDAKAARLSYEGIQTGADAALAPIERVFFYLPLEHAESAELQEESVLAFRRLEAEATPLHSSFFKLTLQQALEHRDTIARFGRFPYRNAALDRSSTPEELDWLAARSSPRVTLASSKTDQT